MRIETRKVEDVLMVDMSGRLDSQTAAEAGDRMVAIAQGTEPLVILNLEKLTYVSSAGLRIIVRAAKLLQVNHGKLVICGAAGGVKSVLTSAGINSLLRIYDTELDALAALSV